MKRLLRTLPLLLLAAVAFAALPAVPTAHAARDYKYGPMDEVWDWFSTLGKAPLEKQQILAKNRAERKKNYKNLAQDFQKDTGMNFSDAKKRYGGLAKKVQGDLAVS